MCANWLKNEVFVAFNAKKMCFYSSKLLFYIPLVQPTAGILLVLGVHAAQPHVVHRLPVF